MCSSFGGCCLVCTTRGQALLHPYTHTTDTRTRSLVEGTNAHCSKDKICSLFFSFHSFICSFILPFFLSFTFFSFLSVPDVRKTYYPASLQERQVVLPKFCLQGLAVGSISQKQRWIPVGTIINKQTNKQTISLHLTRTHVKNKVGEKFHIYCEFMGRSLLWTKVTGTETPSWLFTSTRLQIKSSAL